MKETLTLEVVIEWNSEDTPEGWKPSDRYDVFPFCIEIYGDFTVKEQETHDHPDHDSSGEGPACCNEWG